MKKTLETNKYGLVTSCRVHDLELKSLLFDDKEIILSLGRGKEVLTKILFKEVVFFSSSNLIPNGIVLSCYDFNFGDLPDNADLPDLQRIRSDYRIDDKASIFYGDGSWGFEVLIIYAGDSFEL